MNLRSTSEARPTAEQRGLAERPATTGGPVRAPGVPLQSLTNPAIWVYRSDQFAFARDGANGWETSYGFTTLQQLVDTLAIQGHATRKINKLGICAHGETGGVVRISRSTDLSATNVEHPGILSQLRLIEAFLTRDAMVIFFSCVAGQGVAGTRLLSNLSGVWPHRTIIGFTTFGYIDTSFSARNAPGNIYDTGQTLDGALAGSLIRSGRFRAGRMDENGPSAKWVRDRRMLRTPSIDI